MTKVNMSSFQRNVLIQGSTLTIAGIILLTCAILFITDDALIIAGATETIIAIGLTAWGIYSDRYK